ncbi:histone-like nucleoid-structuring protein Lsr2 [Leifsonia sp. 22587]|uniref:histone-like nucleoid-structuring protein Lsr2 n=1 Tax=Leifsonia sp. 22587 TaxID=3453946 RepID=UPI003F82447E
MAQQVIVQLVDDLDGTPIDDNSGETIVFTIDGVEREIDLSAEHAAQFREALAPYITAGRRRTKAAAPARAGRSAKPDLQAIRTWANANGHEVASRGRVPAAVVDAYNAATKK